MSVKFSALLATLTAILALTLIGVASQPAPPKDDTAPMVQPTTITLLDAGRGDLEPLRWKPKVGVSVRAKMTMAMDMAMTIDGNPMPQVDLPAYVFTIVATTKEPDASGKYPIETVYESVALEGDTDPMIRDALMQALRPLEGAKFTFKMDTRGVISEASTANMPEQILALIGGEQGVRNMIDSLSQPFPAEPIGIGARWKAVQTIQAHNAPAIENTLINELIRRDGDTIEIKMTGTQNGDPQDFDLGIPGVTAKLKRASGTTEGSGFIRLDRLLPIRAENSGNMNLVMQITENGMTQVMDQTVKVRFTIEHLDEEGKKPIAPGNAG